MDIGAWLRSLGLERYEQAFRDNEIDEQVLPKLTADDLTGLGIVLIGHRRKLLESIADLRARMESAKSDGALPQTLKSVATPTPTIGDAQRRQLTVMFCDLVGSTALASRFDPEEVRDVLHSYHAVVSEEVIRLDGFVAKFMGDGVLAYFGYPQAHEDDAERAIRTGLALTERVRGLKLGSETLAVRIGIATGLVIVGDLIGSGEAQERGVIGETPNVAARLQGLAEPNSVVISADTRHLVGNLFEYRDLGPIQVRGLDTPIPVWRVLGPSTVESRFEALHASGLTPLVGREEEADLLFRRWQRAKSGEGQIILISGEPGIGKSRLTAIFQERISGDSHTPLRYFCSPHHRDSPLHPFITQIERAAGFDREDKAETKLDRLKAVVSSLDERATETITLIADLLAVPTGEHPPFGAADPQQRREMTLAMLVRQIEMLSRQTPVLVVFEDAHWADSTSLELLDRAIARARQLPVMIVISFRPEFIPPWLGQAQVTTVALNRLAQRETAILVDRVSGGKTLPAEILARIVERTDGIPLFVEELTKAVLESGLLREDETSYALAGPLPPLAIPSSLQASLLARLDRLLPVKEIAQTAAALGREFSYEMLAAVASHSEAELNHALDQLTEAGLLFRRGTPPRADFAFKHALVQDAAYSTLLRTQRQELHSRIGRTLEMRFPEIVDTQPELLAHHFTEAGLIDAAIEYWRRAGASSVGRSAHVEAAGHIGRALDLLQVLPPSRDRDERDLELTLAFAVPLIAVHGFGSSRVEGCALRAGALSDKLHGSSSQFAARRIAWNSCLMRQPVPRTVSLSRDLLELANADNNQTKLAIAHRALGYSLFIAGELAEATERLAQGASLADTISADEFTLYGEHPSMVCRAYGGQTATLMGFPDSGAKLIEAAVAHARQQNNAHSLAWALGVAAHTFQVQHEPMATNRFASEAIDTAQAHRFPQWVSLGERCKGWAIHQLGEFEDGMSLLHEGVARWYETGAVLHRTHCELCLVEAHLHESKFAVAREHLARTRAHCESYGENYLASEIDRLEAILATHEGAPIAVAKKYVSKSMAIARKQGARLLELRSATLLAQILAEQNERHLAVDTLDPIYGWFTQGFDTADLKQARALLEQLR